MQSAARPSGHSDSSGDQHSGLGGSAAATAFAALPTLVAPHHPGPLAGLRVLELGSFIAGPFACQLLGDLGAEVIKVEEPDRGDAMRHWGAEHRGESIWWSTLARNKQSVSLDLHSPAACDIVLQLSRSCDILVENFRPGTLEKWGLSYERLAAGNPGLVLVRISGFGQTGPRSADTGFGSVAEAAAGLRHTTGDPDRKPARTGISIGDSLAALFAVVGALAAVAERGVSGMGQVVDVAITEAVLAVMESTVADYLVTGRVRERSGGVLNGVAPSNAYVTKGGALVVIAANADAVFRRLCAAMGSAELQDDPRFATHGLRGENMTELDGLIEAWSAERTVDDVLSALAAHAVPAARIATAPDLVQDEQFHARDMIVAAERADGTRVPMVGVVPRFSRTPGAIRCPGPALGAQTDDVLRSAGIANAGGTVQDSIGKGVRPSPNGLGAW